MSISDTRAYIVTARMDLSAASGPAMMKSAMAASVLGWTLLWAEALGIVAFVPLWAAAAMFFSGLALIPFGLSRTPTQAAAPEPSGQHHVPQSGKPDTFPANKEVDWVDNCS